MSARRLFWGRCGRFQCGLGGAVYICMMIPTSLDYIKVIKEIIVNQVFCIFQFNFQSRSCRLFIIIMVVVFIQFMQGHINQWAMVVAVPIMLLMVTIRAIVSMSMMMAHGDMVMLMQCVGKKVVKDMSSTYDNRAEYTC